VVAETIRILLVEDDDGHATLVERNLRRAGLSNPVLRFRDGQEVLDYVFSLDDGHCDCVMLLDINMPRLDGVEVLRRLKADPRTAIIATIILTTTDDPREIERCYQLGCNVYITKPVDYEAFIEAIRRLGFFLQIVKVPTRFEAGG
jgi:CheY-like chemotaxis protein